MFGDPRKNLRRRRRRSPTQSDVDADLVRDRVGDREKWIVLIKARVAVDRRRREILRRRGNDDQNGMRILVILRLPDADLAANDRDTAEITLRRSQGHQLRRRAADIPARILGNLKPHVGDHVVITTLDLD